MRTAITRACRLSGTPHFSPHGLRKRRGSLLSKQGYSLAEVAERLGDSKFVTAESYLFALGDYTEVDLRERAGQAAKVTEHEHLVLPPPFVDSRIPFGQIPCLPGERIPFGSSASLIVSLKRL